MRGGPIRRCTHGVKRVEDARIYGACRQLVVHGSMEQTGQSQSDKFKAAARELECDDDEARWDERLKKVAGQKPAPAKPE